MALVALSGAPPGAAAGVRAASTAALFGQWAVPAARDPRAPAQTNRALAKGKFLVASRQLRDPNFAESVVLLVSYGPGGAMGVVINRPTKVPLSSVLPGVKELRGRKETLYVGGPVAKHQMVLLVRSPTKPGDSTLVFGDVYATGSLAALRQAIRNKPNKTKFHAYAGYAGWAPGQLDAEVARGDWHVIAADAKTVFDRPPSDIWPALIRRLEGQWARTSPSDCHSFNPYHPFNQL